MQKNIASGNKLGQIIPTTTEEPTSHQKLVEQAIVGMNRAYCKYSKFAVGSALLGSSGKIYIGCNVENSSYGATICAERVAMVKAISDGERSFEAIAVVTSNDQLSPPCGVCRQFMSEFGLDIKVILHHDGIIEVTTLQELLPGAFTEF